MQLVFKLKTRTGYDGRVCGRVGATGEQPYDKTAYKMLVAVGFFEK